MHEPVLLTEAIEALAIRPDGTYVDGTFGRGGHSRAILERLGPQGQLIALDRDPEAERAARAIHASLSFARRSPRSRRRSANARSKACCSTWACPRRSSATRSAASRFAPMGRSTCAWTRRRANRPRSGWPWLNKNKSRRSCATMAKNGLLNRLQRRLLMLAAARQSSAPGNLPISWQRRSAHVSRARTRRRAPFRLYGFTSIGSLRKCR